MPYHLDNAFLLGQPLDHGGRLRWDRRLRRRGTLPPLPGAGGQHRPGRPRPGGAPQPAAPELLPRRRGRLQEPGPRRPAGEGLQQARGLLGLPLPGVRRIPLPRARLSGPHRLRREPDHRLRRQRSRTQGDGRVPAGAPGPAGSSTRATTTTGGRCSSETWQAGWTGTSPRSRARPANLAPAPTLQRPDLLTAVSTRPAPTWTAPPPST